MLSLETENILPKGIIHNKRSSKMNYNKIVMRQ